MADDIVTKRGYLGPRPVEGYDPAIDRMSDEIDRLHERISTLEALTDQLATELRDTHTTAQRYTVCWCSNDSEYPSECDSIAALRAYEADKEAHRG